MECKTCGKTIEKEWRKDKHTIKTKPLIYCCKSCANSRVRTEEVKARVSKTLSERFWPPLKKFYRICSICGNEFERPRLPKTKKLSSAKTCSATCLALAHSLAAQNRIKEQGV